MRVREEAGGGLPAASRPRPRVDAFAVKIEEWVDRSKGKVRADKAQSALEAGDRAFAAVRGAVVDDHKDALRAA